jgi:hypothetical protein
MLTTIIISFLSATAACMFAWLTYAHNFTSLERAGYVLLSAACSANALLFSLAALHGGAGTFRLTAPAGVGSIEHVWRASGPLTEVHVILLLVAPVPLLVIGAIRMGSRFR